MRRVTVIDASSLFYAAWHAGSDQAVGFAYGVALEKIRRQASRGFDSVVVACDVGRCFRHELWEGYKARRLEKDEAMLAQMERLQEACANDGAHVLRCPGYEADDIIATVCARLSGIAEVEVYTGDKDLLCLLAIYGVSYRGTRTDALVSTDDVIKRFGVAPIQMPDLLALAGDRVDGIDGVRGVGVSRAAEILHICGDIGALPEALDAKDEDDRPLIRGQVRAALEEALADGSLRRWRSLVALATAPLPPDIDLTSPRPAQQHRPDFGADFPQEVDDMESTPGVAVPVAATETAQETQEQAVDRILKTVDDPTWAQRLEPRDMRQAKWLAAQLFESRLFSGYGSPEQILAVIMAGSELGLGAVTSLRGINIIRGRVAMSSSLMAGLCLARGAEFFDLVESTPEYARYETRRRGQERVLHMEYTLDEAKAEGLYPGVPDRNGNPSTWSKMPKLMIAKTCAARAARAFYPHVVAGVYLPEELETL